MKLVQKLTLGFLGVAMLMAGMGILQFFFIHQIKEDVLEVAHSNVGEVQSSIDIAYRVATISADLGEYLLESIGGGGRPENRRKYQILDDLDQLEVALASLKEATATGQKLAEEAEEVADETQEMEEILDLEVLLHDFRVLVFNTLQALETRDAHQGIAAFLGQSKSIEGGIRARSKDLFVDAIEEIHAEVDEVSDVVDASAIYSAGLALGAFVLALLIGFWVSVPLSRRLLQLKTAARALQHGDRDVQVVPSRSRDEVADLERAFNEMARDLRQSTASIEDLNHQVRKRRDAEAALCVARDELELRVQERTRELEGARIEAESANRTKSEFLANMSHELRTPLNHIIGFTELIVGEKLGSLNEMQREYLNDALESSRHLLVLINDILDLAKVESGKMALRLGQVDVQALLNNCLVMFKEKALKHGIEVILEAEAAPDTVVADEIKLKQIFYNLLSNAFKFTPDAGQIKVRAWKINGDNGHYGHGHEPRQRAHPPQRAAGLVNESENQIDSPCGLRFPAACRGGVQSRENGVQTPAWAIAVSDSGIGIAVADLERIFNPFEQVSNQDCSHHMGTGLGLALTRRMVQLHGGEIRAESNGRNQGATFTILFPQAAQTPEA